MQGKVFGKLGADVVAIVVLWDPFDNEVFDILVYNTCPNKRIYGQI